MKKKASIKDVVITMLIASGHPLCKEGLSPSEFRPALMAFFLSASFGATKWNHRGRLYTFLSSFGGIYPVTYCLDRGMPKNIWILMAFLVGVLFSSYCSYRDYTLLSQELYGE